MAKAGRIQVQDQIADKWWRLNNLYWIIDERGHKVKFRCNAQQTKLYHDFWYMNILLKARQFGGTTFIDIYFLDDCLFFSNLEAGIIAHNKEDAQKIFRRKVKFPYDNLPDELRSQRPLVTDSRQELAFSNGSIIYVATSIRSGTVQRLHISEHGRICQKYPEKAAEIKSGSLNAIHPGGIVWIESTAMQASGDFFEFCETAKANKKRPKLSKMDYKFHFFPWYWDDKNQLLEDDSENFTTDDEEYFSEVEALGETINSERLRLTCYQKNWYLRKKETLGYLIKQEYPSTADEAFEGAGAGFTFSPRYHVIKPMTIPDYAPIYTTFDWGYGAPFSQMWWWVDADGRFYLFAEWYGWKNEPNIGLRLTDSEIAEGILQRETDMPYNFNSQNLKVRLTGHDCFQKKPDYKGGGQGPSTAEVFTKHGVYMTKADSTRHLKIRQFRERLRVPEDENDRPMLQVYDTCHQFIRTIPRIGPDLHNPEDIDTTGEDHCYDSACQLAMFRPMALKLPAPTKTMGAHRIDFLEKGSREDQFQVGQAKEQQRYNEQYLREMALRYGEEAVQVIDYRSTVPGE